LIQPADGSQVSAIVVSVTLGYRTASRGPACRTHMRPVQLSGPLPGRYRGGTYAGVLAGGAGCVQVYPARLRAATPAVTTGRGACEL
jgi:hypothetical protein